MNGILSLRDILVRAFYHRRLILGCIGGGLLAGLIAALLMPRYYKAESLLLLRSDAQPPMFGSAPGGDAGDPVQRLLSTDVEIIRSEPVLLDALARRGDPPHDAQGLASALKRLREHLQVKVEPATTIIRVAYEDRDRRRAIRTVAALVASYGERRSGAYLSSAGKLQRAELARYATEIGRIDDRIREVRVRAGVLDIAQDVQLTGARLDALGQRKAAAEERLAGIGDELSAATTELARTEPQVLAAQESSNVKSNDEAANTLARLRLERAHLVDQYAPTWPGLADVDRRIAAASRQLDISTASRSTLERRVRNPVADQVEARAAALRLEQQSVGGQKAAVDREIRGTRIDAARLGEAQSELHELERMRDVAENVYRQVALDEAGATLRNELLDQRNGSVRVVQPATAPLRPEGRTLILLAGGLVLGMVGAILGCMLADMLRQHFISPEEAARSLGAPLVAELPDGLQGANDPAILKPASELAALVAATEINGRPLTMLRIAGTDAAERAMLAWTLAGALARVDPRGTLVVGLGAQALAPAASGNATDEAVRRTIRIGDAGHTIDAVETGRPGLWTLDAAATTTSAPGAMLTAAAAVFDHLLIVGDDDVQAQLLGGRTYALAQATLLAVRANRTRAAAIGRLRETILAAGGDLLGFVFIGRTYYIPQRIYRWL